MPRKSPNPENPGLDEYGLPPVIHTEVLSHIFGITPRRLHQLITDNRIPAECNFSGDKWRSTMTLREIAGYYRRQADQKRPTSDRELETQTTIENLRALRLKNAKTSRELLPRFVYVQIWGELLTGFKARWMGFAEKMGPRAFRAKDKVEAAEILDREIVDIFAALQDPKFMEDIAAKIRDDDFEQADPDHDSGHSAEAPADLVPPHS